MSPEGFLSGVSRRGLAQAFIRRGVEEGQTGASILSQLREVGMGYRTQNFYEDFRQWQGVKKYETQITGLDPDRLIPEGWTQPSPYKLTSEYLYQMRATYTDIETGTESYTEWGLSTNQRMSKNEIKAFGPIFQEDSPPEGDFEFADVEVYQAWSR